MLRECSLQIRVQPLEATGHQIPRLLTAQHPPPPPEPVHLQPAKHLLELLGRRLVAIRVPVACVIAELHSVDNIDVVAEQLQRECRCAVA